MTDVQLPEGIALDKTGDGIVIIDRHRDQGDIFALAFLGLVVVLFVSMFGNRIYDWVGVVIGLVVTAPLWGWLWLGALRRAVNSTKIAVSPGAIALKIGPVPGGGSETFGDKDVGQVHTKSFENVSSTRGATKPMIVKTHSVWLRTSNGKEVHLVDELDTEQQAQFLVREIQAAMRKR
jgi:hypothetical protein